MVWEEGGGRALHEVHENENNGENSEENKMRNRGIIAPANTHEARGHA